MSTELTNALPGPDSILWKQFPNGVTVLVHENPGSRTAAVHGSLFAGSCLDFPGKTGLSAFVSASLTAGTHSRDFTQISDYLDDIGAGLSFSTGPHSIEFSGKCLSEDLTHLLDLLKEILDEPAFPEPYLETLRERALFGYDPDRDEPEDLPFEIFKNLLWQMDHPYGQLKFESDEITRNITRSDLVKFHEKFFGPKRLILTLAGGFRGQEVMDRCGKIFGIWKKQQELPDEDALFPTVSRKDGHIRYHLNLDEEEEISIVIGTFAPAFNDPDYYSARLGNMILGADSLTSRIGQTIRKKHGLAYNASSIME
ncbi:MAG: insulinase family protein, partial [Anaerolineaceae bacterium]|nr:insulinase family protein [Anaerolineaceae bacterium]